MQDPRPPFRVVRVDELRRLSRCERALARAYRERARSRPADAVVLLRFAERHERSAVLLAARLLALGGRLDREPAPLDDEWLFGPVDDPRTLRWAEQMAVSTYHDHLGDCDPSTAILLREQILPVHLEARDWFERDDREARLSEL